MSSLPLVGRLAPSPTGRLHLGHARSFLLAWWSIRSRGGRVVMRMEDLDVTRVRPGLAEGVLRDLEWLGLDWDGPVLYQSERAEVLRGVADSLLKRGQAYACTCTRKEIELARSAPHEGELPAGVYPGTCRGRYRSLEHARRESGRSAALRFLVPPGEVVTVTDRLRGELAEEVAAVVGDFPITSRDGQVAYQLAVVVDDAHQGVSEVLRGEDLWSSTPRQRLLQRVLGLPSPTWVHVPLVVDEAGERLAKRTDGLSLEALREGGTSPEQVVGWVARSARMPVEGPCRAEEVLGLFDLTLLPRRPVPVDGRAREELSPGGGSGVPGAVRPER